MSIKEKYLLNSITTVKVIYNLSCIFDSLSRGLCTLDNRGRDYRV